MPIRSSTSCLRLLPALLALNACTTGPDFIKPDSPGPQQWTALPSVGSAAIDSSAVSKNWWQKFNDPILSALIERALNQNLSLRNAATLLAQSRAQTGIAAADQFPQLNANTSYTRMQASQKGILSLAKTLSGGSSAGTAANGSGSGSAAGGTGAGAIGVPAAGVQPFSLYQYGFDASWELDLWGRVRREQEAAAADLQATQEQQHAAQLSVIAEVAKNYIELRRLQASRTLSTEQRDLASQQHELIKLQAKHGVVTAIEVENAAAALAEAEAALPSLAQQISLSLNQLSLLLGEQPGVLNAELSGSQALPSLPPRLELGLPAELAQRRPDIREAEARLHSALADIGMAQADFYPRFTLSGSTGLQALRLRDLGNWSAWQYAIGPSIMLPIFQGGRLEATLELRQAQHQQAAIAYHNTLLAAWHEIDSNLAAYQQARLRLQALQAGVSANQQSRQLQQQRFEQGLITRLPVLQAQARLLQAKQTELDTISLSVLDLIAVYKALGGGWVEVE